ncbi:FAD:protein FMN transferase [Clostridium gasigenes]|uniref:FAD:protein FMN transferase n=1 Tax=Clostridium gasigenes TaxID=94869 RepID=UPI0014385ED9|nr:FAD:protein FMN transferase [Clostridium gasigenes]NKF06435.1 FAD:protein FMN transferase [Clostridium gasigenes]QSW20313.1 FAD:protein FMN transferase [Clostridium gasigenes]
MKNKQLKSLVLSTLLISCIISFVGCSKNNKVTSPLSRTESIMGTVVKVTLYDSDDEKILDKAFDRVREIEKSVSINKDGTILDKVNDSSGISPVIVDDDTLTIVKKGLEYSNISNGLFDITIGPLVKLWSIGLPEERSPQQGVPSKEELDVALSYINHNAVELNEEDKSIFLKNPHMIIDLGGIAKGYAADKVSEVLTENNVHSAIIDLGGNIFAHGKKTSGENWKIGIQNPASSRNDILGTIEVNNKSVVTSGTYERFVEYDGVKYHHILNPKTGFPYENNISGISIISDKSIDGDALSTSVFAMGVEDGLAFIESQSDIEAIFVTTDNKIYLSSGMKTIFNLTNTEFQIAN